MSCRLFLEVSREIISFHYRSLDSAKFEKFMLENFQGGKVDTLSLFVKVLGAL